MNFEDRPADTTPQAGKRTSSLKLIREMDPSEKLRQVFMLSANLRALAEAGVPVSVALTRPSMKSCSGWRPSTSTARP